MLQMSKSHKDFVAKVDFIVFSSKGRRASWLGWFSGIHASLQASYSISCHPLRALASYIGCRRVALYTI
jgi:hypothetical protein